ncbi:excinuclease ABC subunit UvrC [bacterium SCSIO 12643]|nr:excinuclease ABC subunit UvrC [bacterium SCSIO 12643]
MDTPEHIKEIVRNLPKKPGVYRFYDKDRKILYVGKAKYLKNRVSSYFNKIKYENRKTKLLVRKIDHIEYIVVESEYEALLLENSLIKKHQPHYNVALRDDKTYPWICIKKEPFPRVFSTRNLIKDGSEYYGPYASVKMMHTVLNIISKLYKLRTCSYHLSPTNIANKKYRVCLEYHIGNCLGGCEGKQSEYDYDKSIDEIRHILKGNLGDLTKDLKETMMRYASELRFEKAQELKERVELLENYQAKSTVVNYKIHNVDVFSIVSDSYAGYVNFMKINSGAVVQLHTLEIRKKMEETDQELLAIGIAEIRQKFGSTSKELYLSQKVDMEMDDLKIIVPKIGDKKKLIEMSLRNAKYFMMDRYKAMEKVDPESHSNRVMQQVQKDLRLKELPVHIECFDNSNIQGEFPVAACVVFKNGKPSKRDYRHFNIKTVVGPDDFASMEEIVYRRYSRLLREGESLPQLVVIDGGKGQLHSAVNSLERLGLMGKIAVVGIAKRLEEIYFPGDSIPIYLDKRSESLRIIQFLRNEAHRFGITHHRNQRGKSIVKSELHQIKGIGPKISEQLLTKIGSVKRIKEATLDELSVVVGEAKAKIVWNYFNS